MLLVAATAPLGLVSPELVFAPRARDGGPGGGLVVRAAQGTASGPRRLVPRDPARLPSLRPARLIGSLFVFLVLKSDIVLVTYMRGAAETGYYSIAVGLADILLMLPMVVGTILFPKLSAAPDLAARWRLVRRVLKVMVPATPVGLLATYFAAGPLIRLAYGAAFDPSVAAVGWLLPGIGFYAINSILMNFLASCGMPLVVVFSPFIALLVNVAANLWLVPSMGFVGASVSSSLAYGLMLVMSLIYIRLRLLRDRHA